SLLTVLSGSRFSCSCSEASSSSSAEKKSPPDNLGRAQCFFHNPLKGRGKMGTVWVLLYVALSLGSFASAGNESVSNGGLEMNYYRDSCPQAEEIVEEKSVCSTHSTRTLHFLGSETFSTTASSRYLDSIKEAVERECPGVVSCANVLVLSARDGIVSLRGPYIPLKMGRRDGRKSRANVLEMYLPDHNDTISTVLTRFKAIGIDTPGVVALLGAHNVGRTHCVKLVHRLYPEVDPMLDVGHVERMMKKCPDTIPNPKAVQYVRNDRGTPMKLDNNYYRNLMDNNSFFLAQHF
ncbi:hypothetical protein KI387_030838, partial [Taxus chinensis]